jgi:hypothetical protein
MALGSQTDHPGVVFHDHHDHHHHHYETPYELRNRLSRFFL